MIIKNLTGTSFEQLHKAFLSAFSDYEVKIDMPFEKFRTMLHAKDFDRNLSVGCFNGDELTGFILIGFREKNGLRLSYDIATGVTAGNQNRGVGGMLLKSMLKKSAEEKISAFYLEVLENNEAARHLYEKQGFRIIRRLRCFEIKTADVDLSTADFAEDTDGTDLTDVDFIGYNSFEPTWQNSLETWRNSCGQHNLVSLKDGHRLAAYGIVHKSEGGVMQFGIHPEYGGSNAGKQLLSLLARHTSAELLRFINVEDDSRLCRRFESYGFINTVNQYEMVYKF